MEADADKIQIIDYAGAHNLYDLFDRMRDRPALLLGGTSLDRMASFVTGYQLALQIHGIGEQLNPNFDD